MDSAVLALPNDPDQLKAEVVQLRGAVKENEQTIAEKEQRIEQLLDYILLLRKRRFGASADRPNKDQITLFDEAELEQLLADLELPEGIDAEPKAQKKTQSQRKKPVRRPLPAHFNRVEKVIDIPDEEKAAMGMTGPS